MIFHHLGIATPSIDTFLKSGSFLRVYRQVAEFVDDTLGVRGIFLESPAAPRLEILENLPKSNVLDPWLKSGSPIYHMAFEISTGDFHQSDSSFELKQKTPSVFFEKDVCFHLHSSRFLIEYIHEK